MNFNDSKFAKLDNSNKIAVVGFVVGLLSLLVFNGGFNSLPTLIISFIIFLFTVILVIRFRYSKITVITILLLILSVIYFASSFMVSPVVTAFISSVIPASLICFVTILAILNKESKLFLFRLLTLIGVVTAIFGICLCFLPIEVPGGTIDGRLMFPFQYANTSGIWYLIVAILCWQTQNFKYRVASVLPIAALLLTKSGGAIAIFVIVAIIYIVRWFWFEKHERKFNILAILFIVCSCAAGVIFALNNTERIFQASQTFIERFIQIFDGWNLLLTSPLIGVGPDQWQFIYPYIQSAQYTASKIHCGYLQIALDGGLIALAVFLIFVIYSVINLINNKKWTMLLCASVILVHSLIDFDFSYPFMMLLLFIFLDDKKFDIKFIVNLIITFIALCFVVVGIYFSIQLNNVVNLPTKVNQSKEIKIDSQPEYILNDVKASTYLTIVLSKAQMNQEAYNLCLNTRYASSTQEVFVLDCLVKQQKFEEAKQFLDYILSSQPYNVDLYENVYGYISEKNNSDMADVYNKCVEHSNNLIKLGFATHLSSQKQFDLL